jgi:cell division protein FtsL
LQRSKIKRTHVSYGSKFGRLKKEKNLRPKFFLILVVLVFLSIIHIWQRVTVLTLANEIERINVGIDKQQREYKYLQVEVASLSAVERIERLAEEMGFVYPSLEQIRFLPEAPDSSIFERQGLIRSIWTKLKGISP